MPKKLPPGEAERRARERRKSAWAKMASGEAYQHYDPNDGIGYGNPDQWRAGAAAQGFTMVDIPPTAQTKDEDLRLLGLKIMPNLEVVLQRAYRLAAFKAHPDHGGTEAAFVALQQAFEHCKKRIAAMRQ